MSFIAQSELAASALNHLQSAIFVVDEEARVLLANRAAERLCAAGMLLAIAAGRLASTVDDEALKEAVARATAPDGGRAAGLLLRDGQFRNPLHMIIAPLAASAGREAPFERPLAFIAAVPAHESPRRVEPLLKALYGLTSAEVRCARLVSDGMSPAQVAESLRLSVQTVRSQLKAVYAKTGIRRQAELSRIVAQLASVAGHIVDDGSA